MELCVVMPVYNEAEAIDRVVQEWSQLFAQLQIDYRLLLINDGSTDATAQHIQRLQADSPTILALEQTNRGHGQSCIDGYSLALQHGAAWIFQIDSDGQCDPRYFANFWAHRHWPAIFGQRVARQDGAARRVISLFTRVAVLLATGVSVRDANVPYRLMRRDVLELAIQQCPKDVYLANILVSVILQHGLQERLQYLPIGFRKRTGGEPSVRWLRFVALGWGLFRSLLKHRRHIYERANQIRSTTH